MEPQKGNNLKSWSRERLPDRVASLLKELIFSGRVAVGQRLPSERELAETHRVSRVVVREALRSLERSGLIEIKKCAWGGAFVIDDTFRPFTDAINDLFTRGELTLEHLADARLEVESASVRLAALNIGQDGLNRLRAINRRLLEEIDDRYKFRANNLEFHVAIAELSGNPLIKMMVRALLEAFNISLSHHPHRSWSRDAHLAHQRHQEIIQAMEAGDLKACQKVMGQEAELSRFIEIPEEMLPGDSEKPPH